MKQSRIFVVDDDADDRDFLKDAFSLADCTKKLLFFYNYEDMLACLDGLPVHELPHLIVLDNHIRSITATATVHELLSNLRLTNTKLAIYTTSLPTSMCEGYMKQGVNLCLQKGSNLDAVNEAAFRFCRLAASAWEGELN